MSTLNMKGPYLFNKDTVDEIVSKDSAGNYALGYLNDDKGFVVKYVGRSDKNVRDRLKQHIGEKYSYFKFSYADSLKDGFEKECQNYHDFKNQLNNKEHPDRPEGKDWTCPCCDTFK